MNDASPAAAKGSGYLRSAILLWVAVMGFICAGIVFHFSRRDVTQVYQAAVQKWIEGKPLFDGLHYFPQFVFLFFPFHLLGSLWGGIVWRLVSTGLLAWGFLRLVSLIDLPRTSRLFFFATLIVLVPSFDALRSGQDNVIFAAFTLHAAYSIARSRWSEATVWLLLALVAKPIGVVMILLAVLVYRSLAWRIAVGIAVFLLSPFAFGRAAYVWSQYWESMRHLLELSVITENRFADLNGLLRKLGFGVTGTASQILRVAAGLGTAFLWWLGSRRFRQPQQACLLLALATTYLMLFNPMTEENSYVIVLPALAWYGLHILLVEGSRLAGWVLIAAAVSIGLLPEPLRKVVPDFGLWWRPVVMLIFSGVLIASIFACEPGAVQGEMLPGDEG